MKYYYAVIDTNVLVSALLKWDSVPGNIMELAFGGTIIPVFNDKIIQEYTDVLLRPKFHFPETIIDDVIRTIKDQGIYIKAETIAIDLPDPKDRVFYEVVMEERKKEDAHLVTGNIKHFPMNSFIVTPRQMLDIVLSSLND